MDIDFTAAGASPFRITGSTPEEGPGDLDATGRSALQVQELFRTDTVAIFDRKNDRVEMAFSIERSHASPGEAMLYWLDHLQRVKGTGTVLFTVREITGAVVARRLLSPAGIVATGGRPDGHSTRFSYQIIGGRLTNA